MLPDNLSGDLGDEERNSWNLKKWRSIPPIAFCLAWLTLSAATAELTALLRDNPYNWTRWETISLAFGSIYVVIMLFRVLVYYSCCVKSGSCTAYVNKFPTLITDQLMAIGWFLATIPIGYYTVGYDNYHTYDVIICLMCFLVGSALIFALFVVCYLLSICFANCGDSCASAKRIIKQNQTNVQV